MLQDYCKWEKSLFFSFCFLMHNLVIISCMRNSGFTLLELSIVIVIIGLIVAGISAGQSLVRQAQLRQFTSNINQYKVAINSFTLQYDALPGDMDNTTSYWPTASTADGNGDGNVNFDAGSCLQKILMRGNNFHWLGLSMEITRVGLPPVYATRLM